jgi:hypothetical protein
MTGLNGSLNGLVDQLKQLLDQAEHDASIAEEILAQKRQDVARVKGMLRAAGELTPEKKKKASPKRDNPSTLQTTREHVLELIRQHIRVHPAHVDEIPWSFRVAHIANASTMHQTSVQHALNDLREEGVIRACGRIPIPGVKGRAPMVYALVRDD